MPPAALSPAVISEAELDARHRTRALLASGGEYGYLTVRGERHITRPPDDDDDA